MDVLPPTPQQLSGPDGKQIGKAYFDWFIETLSGRLEVLRATLGFTPTMADVDAAAEAFCRKIADPANWDATALNRRGIALCRDFGAMFGEMLISARGELHWAFYEPSSRIDVDRFRTVILGFPAGAFEPVLTCISQASEARLKGRCRMADILRYWFSV